MPSAKICIGKELWVVLALGASAAARLSPTLDGLTPVSQSVLGATAAGTILWVTEALPLGLTALLVTVLLGLCPGLRLPECGERLCR
jgi:solute carrier family 13 (sodium-dependent dicarboxylate transporter), member 2/3/5